MDNSLAALVNAATQMQQSQVAQTAQVLVLKAVDVQTTGALAPLQTPPLATIGELGTLVNTSVKSP